MDDCRIGERREETVVNDLMNLAEHLPLVRPGDAVTCEEAAKAVQLFGWGIEAGSRVECPGQRGLEHPQRSSNLGLIGPIHLVQVSLVVSDPLATDWLWILEDRGEELVLPQFVDLAQCCPLMKSRTASRARRLTSSLLVPVTASRLAI